MRIPLLALAAAVAVAIAPTRSEAQRSSAPPLNDAIIVGVWDAANGWDIATGALAARKASNADVKAFGKMLLDVHTAVRQQGRDLAAKLGATPTPVAKDFPLLVAHEATMKKLESLSGAAFDKAFLEHEVAYHKAVIDAVTTTYLPAIKNAELKAYVEKIAPAFQAHMQGADALLKKLP